MGTPRPLERVRVLVAHDDEAVRNGIRRLLAPQGAEVLEATTCAAVGLVRTETPHVLLLGDDIDAPAPSQQLRDVASDPELIGTAVILMSPGADAQRVLDALAHGAVDVWAGSVPTPELIARVRIAYRSRMLLDLALRRYVDLEALAYRDELTELPNRRSGIRQLEVSISRARRHSQALSALLIDADRFKEINDAHGHATGDLVLRGSPAACASGCAARISWRAGAARSSSSCCRTRPPTGRSRWPSRCVPRSPRGRCRRGGCGCR